MSFRKNWLPNLVTSLLQLLAGGLIYKQEVQPWVENLLGLPRDRLLRAVGYCIGAAALLFGLLRGRVMWPRIKSLAQGVHQRLALLARRRSMDLTPEALPPRTASATAIALQPLAGGAQSPLPHFVTANNSAWMLQEFTRQQRIALRAAVNDPSMWRNAALLDSPHG
jgi:hypothetical protein